MRLRFVILIVLVLAGGLNTPEAAMLPLTLEEATQAALKNNRARTVSAAAVAIAEAQHKQALSAFWPDLRVTVTGTVMDQAPNFVFPGASLNLGPQTAALAQSIAVSQLIAAGLTPGTPAFAAALPGATAAAQNGLLNSTTPQQNVKLMDPELLVSSLNLVYPLYTGGKRTALEKQARLGVDAAREAARRTDLEVVRDVRQIYYGCLLADALYGLGRDTLERFEVTLELTERLYTAGSTKVKKTDYLRTQVVVSSIRAALEALRTNTIMARAALGNTMGLAWDAEPAPREGEIPFAPYQGDLAKLVDEARRSNPQLAQVRIGLNAGAAKVDEAWSGHLPIFVLFGNLQHVDNNYHQGLMTAVNRDSWNVGLRMELPLFTGFRTQAEISEAKARLEKLQGEKGLLEEGLALQVKDAFLQVGQAQGQVTATKEAVGAATENRDLNVRAYQEELVETKDVIEAQLIEFFINGQHLKALYDHQASQAQLEFVVGKSAGLPGSRLR